MAALEAAVRKRDHDAARVVFAELSADLAEMPKVAAAQ